MIEELHKLLDLIRLTGTTKVLKLNDPMVKDMWISKMAEGAYLRVLYQIKLAEYDEHRTRELKVSVDIAFKNLHQFHKNK